MPLSAIVLAIICSWNSSKGTVIRSDVFFRYTLTSYTQIEVEDPDNWVQVFDISVICGNANRKACGIRVDESSTVGFSPNRTLKYSTYIMTSLYTPDFTYFVISGGDVLSARNRL